MWRYVRQSFVRHLSPANEAPPSPPSTSINPVVIATNNNNTAISTLVSASSSSSGNGSNSWKDNSKPVAAAAAFLFGTANTSTSPSDANHSHRLPLHHDVSSHGTTPNDGASSSKTVGDDIMEPHVYPNTNRLLRIVRPRRKNYDDDNNNNEMDDVHTSGQCEEPTTTTTTTTKNNNDDNRSTTKTTIGNNKPNPTFRQRRMTLHPSHKRKDDDGEGKKDVITNTNTARKSTTSTTTSTTTVSNANSTVDNDNNNGDRIMYPIPMNIQKEEEEEADILSTRHHLHHDDDTPNDDKKKIASYSCNGIEPQHRLLVEDVPEEDEDENEKFLPYFRNRFLHDGTLSEDGSSFLSHLLFGSSSRNDDYDGGKDDDDVRGTRSRRRTRLVTVVESKVNQDRGHVICPYGCQNDRGGGGGGGSSDGTITNEHHQHQHQPSKEKYCKDFLREKLKNHSIPSRAVTRNFSRINSFINYTNKQTTPHFFHEYKLQPKETKKTNMKSFTPILLTALLTTTSAFSPSPTFTTTTTSPRTSSTLNMAKYNTMDEILEKFPEDLPVLINFYDAKTEDDIKGDIVRAKGLLKDRCTVCSIKQQDYPELAKLWDADEKSPSMILFQDGKPLTRIYEETFYLDIVSKVSKFCPE